jgi:WD40 repeat protein
VLPPAELQERLLGRYEILAAAGEGGDATVFKALDHRHDRTVALKIRSVVDLERAQAVEEAGVLLSLDPHRLLPLVRDDFFVDERHVVVMDWVEGRDLGRLLREQGRPGLPLTSVLNYLAQAAEALTHLHNHDPVVVHGDLKPDNLILTTGGRVVLVDFGISTRGGENRRDRRGTRGFVAPEVAAGATPSPAADVYSLAATAHALLTGQPPSGLAPDLQGIDPTAAAAVRDALDRGLALDPARRPASAGEFVERLRAGWHATLPTGAMTFMLTNVVGSASLWDASPAAMSKALVRHDAVVTRAVEEAGGRLIKSMGEGDSTVSVFPRAGDALRAALAAHAGLAAEEWPTPVPIRIRSALHTGDADLRDGQYFGPALNRAARLRSLADAEEILLSELTADVVANDLPQGVELVGLGTHRLRGSAEPELVHAVSGPHVSAPPLAVCPYRGLASYEQEHAELFFGRSAVVEEALERLRVHPFLAIVGASGSGKSSLVRAGIVPAVLAGDPGGDDAAAIFVPGDDPLGALRRALREAAERGARTLLAVDQFEELFTRSEDRQARAAFVDELLGSGHATLIAVRADFYGHCASITDLAREVAAHQLLLGPMSADELREAIEQPAVAVGLELEDGLTDRLVDDVAGEPGALPLLSHALVETWERRDGRRLTLAGYQAAGGARGAIARTAESTFAALDDDGRRTARRIFLRLVEPGEATEDTRRRAAMSELTAVHDDAAKLAVVLDELSAARLVTVDADGVEVAHEALIREWPRLRGWIDDDRERLRSLRHLTNAAAAWLGSGRDEGELYRGARLAAAERLEHRELAPVEREFLIASREASDREQAELRARVVEQARVNRRLRILLSGVAVLALVAVVSGLVAFVQRQRADRETRVARAANRVASEQLARGLAAAAVDLRTDDPFLATMLAAESTARFRPVLPEARSALVQSRIALGGRKLVPYGDPMRVGDALVLAVRPGGDLAVTGNRDGTIEIWDIGRRERIGQLNGPSGGIQRLAFTADGRWLVAGSADNRVWRWDMSALRASRTPLTGSVLADVGAVVWAVAAAPAGALVAAATQAGELWLLDAATGRRLGEPLRPRRGGLMSAAFSPDGRTLLAGSLIGEVFVWALPSRRLRFPPVAAHSSLVWDVLVSPANREVVTTTGDGEVRVWDIRTGARLRIGPFDSRVRFVPVGVRGVTFGRNTLALGGQDGAVYSWSLSGRRLVGKTRRAHQDLVRAGARDADARLLVTLGDDRTLQVWTERARPEALRVISRLEVEPTALAAAPDASVLAVGTADGAVRLLDPATGEERSRLPRRAGSVTGVVFAGEERIATARSDGTLTVWDTRGRILVQRRRAHSGRLTALAASPGPRPRLATGGADGTVRLWEAADLTPLGRPLASGGAGITDVAFARDGRTVAASSERGRIASWSIDGALLQDFSVLDDTVWAIAPGAGDALAVAAADEVLSLWSLPAERAPRRRYAIGSHRGGALDVAFVDPTTVAVTAVDGRLRLWDVASGAPIGRAIAVSTTAVRHVAAAPDGVIWTANEEGEVARIDALSVRVACAVATASFDRRQRVRLLGGRPLLACAAAKRG